MSTETTDSILDAIEHLPEGATLVIHFSWDDYERLVKDLQEGPQVRVSYDCGRLEIMSTLQKYGVKLPSLKLIDVLLYGTR